MQLKGKCVIAKNMQNACRLKQKIDIIYRYRYMENVPSILKQTICPTHAPSWSICPAARRLSLIQEHLLHGHCMHKYEHRITVARTTSSIMSRMYSFFFKDAILKAA